MMEPSSVTPKATRSQERFKHADVKPKVLHFGTEAAVSAEKPEEDRLQGNELGQQTHVKSKTASPSPSAVGIDEASATTSTSPSDDEWNIYDDVSSLSNCSTTCWYDEHKDTLRSSPHCRRMSTIEQFCTPSRRGTEGALEEWEDAVARDAQFHRTPPSGGRWEWMKTFKKK